jgi:predicted RNase H-like nuclease (RuvC/YqgF family)
MALAMEERMTTEMLGQNNAIETLKHEVEVLGDDNTKLSAEVTRLSAEVVHLKRQVEEAQTSEVLAVERASKAKETCDNLRSALDKEKQSSAALQE